MEGKFKVGDRVIVGSFSKDIGYVHALGYHVEVDNYWAWWSEESLELAPPTPKFAIGNEVRDVERTIQGPVRGIIYHPDVDYYTYLVGDSSIWYPERLLKVCQ